MRGSTDAMVRSLEGRDGEQKVMSLRGKREEGREQRGKREERREKIENHREERRKNK